MNLTADCPITAAELANLLRYAATKRLSAERGNSVLRAYFSCVAVKIAGRTKFSKVKEDRFWHWFKYSMLPYVGMMYWCDPHFTEFDKGPERQGARFAWLMHLADLADEGLFHPGSAA